MEYYGKKSLEASKEEELVSNLMKEMKYIDAIKLLELCINYSRMARCDQVNYSHLYLKLGELYLLLGDRESAMNEFSKYLLAAKDSEVNKFHRAKIYYIQILEAYQKHETNDIIATAFEISRKILHCPIERNGDTALDLFRVILLFFQDEKYKFEPILDNYIKIIEPTTSIQPEFMRRSEKLKEEIKATFKNLNEEFIGYAMEMKGIRPRLSLDPLFEKIKILMVRLRDIISKFNATEIINFLDMCFNNLAQPDSCEKTNYILKLMEKFSLRDTSDMFQINRAIGWFYFLLRSDDISQYYFNVCLQHLESNEVINSLQKLAEFHEDLGYAYSFYHKGEKSIHHFTEYFKTRQQIIRTITNTETSHFYFNCGLALHRSGSFTEATNWFIEVVSILKNQNLEEILKVFMAESYATISEISEIELCIKKIRPIFEGTPKMGKKYSNVANLMMLTQDSIDNLGKYNVNLQSHCTRLREMDINLESIKSIEMPIFPIVHCKKYAENKNCLKPGRDYPEKTLFVFPIAPENLLETESLKSEGMKANHRKRSAVVGKDIHYLMKFSKISYQFLKLYDSSIGVSNGNSQYNVVIEHCKYTLESYFRNNQIEQSKVMEIVRDLFIGFFIMKTKGYVHGYINPRSIFVTFKGQAKIGNFFNVKKIPETDKDILYHVEPSRRGYLSPETYICDKRMNLTVICSPFKCDVFSLGLTLLECCGESIFRLNKLIYKDLNLSENQIKLIEEVNTKGFSELENRSEEQREFYYSNMQQLQIKIENTINNMTNYQYLDSILKKMLVVNPNERVDFDELVRLVS